MNSRRKGAKNERMIAALLEKWTGKKFAKTPASGGLQWKSSMAKGDVVCTTEGHLFPFCIEAKFHKKIDFSHLLIPGIENVDILTFWSQCKRDAESCNKIPILLMRYNGLASNFHFLVIETDFWNELPKHYLFGKMVNITHGINYFNHLHKLKLTIVRSTAFFKLDYKDVKKAAKAYIHEKKKSKTKG
jgi:Holliday junction resolvase